MTHAEATDVPVVALSAADHIRGNNHGSLTLLEDCDYECPACMQAEPVMRHRVDTVGKRLRLVFRRCNGEMADRIHTQRVQHHRRAGGQRGVRATPAFFLNGSAVDGSFSLQKLEKIIHAALAVR